MLLLILTYFLPPEHFFSAEFIFSPSSRRCLCVVERNNSLALSSSEQIVNHRNSRRILRKFWEKESEAFQNLELKYFKTFCDFYRTSGEPATEFLEIEFLSFYLVNDCAGLLCGTFFFLAT